MKNTNYTSYSYRWFNKPIAVITILAFLMNIFGVDITYASEKISGPSEGTNLSIAAVLPELLGEIKEFDNNGSDKTIIHIQDAHCSYSCQKSISGLINFYSEKFDIDTVILEGASGEFDFSLFSGIDDIITREKAADFFIKEGRLSGAEYFSIVYPGRVDLRGLEDEDLYLKNLKTYIDYLPEKEAVAAFLAKLKNQVNDLKLKVFHDKLIKFDQMVSGYKEKTIETDEYLRYLSEETIRVNIDLSGFQQMKAIFDLLESEEQIDFRRAEAERETMIDELTKKVGSIELERFVQNIVLFEQKKISANNFYAYLTRMCLSLEIDISGKYPVLAAYINYAYAESQVDKDRLLSEMGAFEIRIADRLCADEDQRGLYKLSRKVDTLRDFFSMTLTFDQYLEYSEYSRDLSTQKLVSTINGYSERYRSDLGRYSDLTLIDEALTEMDRFYSIAFERDDAFVTNISNQIKNEKAVIVITGGFHADNLKKLIKDKGFNYLSVMPRLNPVEEMSTYFGLISGGLTRIETMLEKVIGDNPGFNVNNKGGAKINASTLAMYSYLNDLGVKASEITVQGIDPQKKINLFELSVYIVEGLLSGKEEVRVGMPDGSAIVFASKRSSDKHRGETTVVSEDLDVAGNICVVLKIEPLTNKVSEESGMLESVGTVSLFYFLPWAIRKHLPWTHIRGRFGVRDIYSCLKKYGWKLPKTSEDMIVGRWQRVIDGYPKELDFVAQHAIRVAMLSILIYSKSEKKERTRLPKQLRDLITASLAHDLGKAHSEIKELAVSSKKFSDSERETMRRHSERSVEALEELFKGTKPRITNRVKTFIKYHHPGYYLKQGESIHRLSSRADVSAKDIEDIQIIFAADEVDARHDQQRPHRKEKAHSWQERRILEPLDDHVENGRLSQTVRDGVEYFVTDTNSENKTYLEIVTATYDFWQRLMIQKIVPLGKSISRFFKKHHLWIALVTVVIAKQVVGSFDGESDTALASALMMGSFDSSSSSKELLLQQVFAEKVRDALLRDKVDELVFLFKNYNPVFIANLIEVLIKNLLKEKEDRLLPLIATCEALRNRLIKEEQTESIKLTGPLVAALMERKPGTERPGRLRNLMGFLFRTERFPGEKTVEFPVSMKKALSAYEEMQKAKEGKKGENSPGIDTFAMPWHEFAFGAAAAFGVSTVLGYTVGVSLIMAAAGSASGMLFHELGHYYWMTWFLKGSKSAKIRVKADLQGVRVFAKYESGALSGINSLLISRAGPYANMAFAIFSGMAGLVFPAMFVVSAASAVQGVISFAREGTKKYQKSISSELSEEKIGSREHIERMFDNPYINIVLDRDDVEHYGISLVRVRFWLEKFWNRKNEIRPSNPLRDFCDELLETNPDLLAGEIIRIHKNGENGVLKEAYKIFDAFTDTFARENNYPRFKGDLAQFILNVDTKGEFDSHELFTRYIGTTSGYWELMRESIAVMEQNRRLAGNSTREKDMADFWKKRDMFRHRLTKTLTLFSAVEILSRKPDLGARSVPESAVNFSCGIVCASGHEGTYMALDEQLSRLFEKLRLYHQDKIEEDKPLTEAEADIALEVYLKNNGNGVPDGQVIRKEFLEDLRRQIRGPPGSDDYKGIDIFFVVPETDTTLFWVKEPGSGKLTYAAGHSNREGTRIHVSLPFVLTYGVDPVSAARSVAKHDLDHIKKVGHRIDEGFFLAAEASKIELKEIKRRKRLLKSVYKKLDKESAQGETLAARLETPYKYFQEISWRRHVADKLSDFKEKAEKDIQERGYVRSGTLSAGKALMDVMIKPVSERGWNIGDSHKKRLNPVINQVNKMLAGREKILSDLGDVDAAGNIIWDHVEDVKEEDVEALKTLVTKEVSIRFEGALMNIDDRYSSAKPRIQNLFLEYQKWMDLRKDVVTDELLKTMRAVLSISVKAKGLPYGDRKRLHSLGLRLMYLIELTQGHPLEYETGLGKSKTYQPEFELDIPKPKEPEAEKDVAETPPHTEQSKPAKTVPLTKETITLKARETFDVLCGEPYMKKTRTVGVVIKTESGTQGDFLYDLVDKEFAGKMKALSGSVDVTAKIRRGLMSGNVAVAKEGNIRYVVYLDDGTSKSKGDIDAFIEELKDQNDPDQETLKERTFVWIRGDADWDGGRAGQLAALKESAYVAGLTGDYIPVWWQMFAGPIFLNYVYSKIHLKKYAGRWKGLEQLLIRCIKEITPDDFHDKIDLIKIFKDLLILPVAHVWSEDIEQNRTADSAVLKSV